MSTITPSNDVIITPGTQKKSPFWTVLLAALAVFCCCCLCSSVFVIWVVGFGVNIITSILSGLGL